MKLIDQLLRRATPQRLVSDATRWLQRHGLTQIEADETRMEVRGQRPDGTRISTNLTRLWGDWRVAPRRERDGRLERFLSELMSPALTAAQGYAAVRPHLLPVVRTLEDVEAARLSVARLADGADFAMAYRSWVGDLVIALVVDTPESMLPVQQSQLDGWGVGWDDALKDAMDNLRGLPAQVRWVALAPGLWRAEYGDSYDSSRLLLPELIQRAPAGQPVAMVPFRDALLVTSAADQQGLDAMLAWAVGGLDGTGRWLSQQPLALQGHGWAAHALSGRAAALQALLSMRHRMAAYASQRDALVALHGESVFVAAFTAAQAQDGTLINYAVWPEDSDALLPQCDNVVMAYLVAGEQCTAVLPWATVRAHFGDLLEATCHVPPQWRARRFPDRARLQQALQQAGHAAPVTAAATPLPHESAC